MLGTLNRIALQLIAPKTAIRAKYNEFRELLRHDRSCHKRLAELEELYYQNNRVDLNRVRRLHRELAAGVLAMAGCLERMAPASYLTLQAYARKIDYYGRIALTSVSAIPASSFILHFNRSSPDELQTGGKGLHLCQLHRRLGLPVPEGFIVSTSAFAYFLEANNLRARIDDLLGRVDIRDKQSLTAVSAELMNMVAAAEVPERLARELHSSLAALAVRSGADRFAVRSSAVGEDSTISFAGQYESVLGVAADQLLAAYRQVLAGKYSANAIYYRINAGLLDEDTPMAVVVQRMVDARLSGVATTGETAGRAREGVIIRFIEGLGDRLVGGRCTPETVVARPAPEGFLVERGAPSALADEQARRLASWARRIEQYFQRPQEIEWSLDQQGSLYLLQARPHLIQEKAAEVAQLDLSGLAVLLDGGEGASLGAACGPVYRVAHEQQLAEVPGGAVLVTAVIPPTYVLALDRVCAVVAEQGSGADHFASVAREAGVPLLVKAGGAMAKLASGRMVTVCADLGKVFDGCSEQIIAHSQRPKVEQGVTPVREAFARAAPFIFPLQLVNPAEATFAPDHCRSLHDLIRFVHEKGVQAMFVQTATTFAKRSAATLLDVPIPVRIYLLDVDADLERPPARPAAVRENEPRSAPLRAVLQGMAHPGITWHHHAHFDWKSFSEATMAGGIVTSDDSAFASYAVVGQDYLNLNLRFGYHFVLLDALCGAVVDENHIMLRFAGGGGQAGGIALRLAFIAEILRRLGFSVETKGDLLDGQLMRYSQEVILAKLDVVGRLLAATTLMDMVIRDEDMVNRMVEGFMNEDYDFSRTGEA